MKKIPYVVITIILLFTILAACSTPEQPLTVADLLDLGERYLLELDYEQALIPFIAVIEIDPMIPRGYTGAADAYIGLKMINDAINILKTGANVLPDDLSIIEALAELYTSNEMYDDALSLLQRSVNNTAFQPRLQPILDNVLFLTHIHDWSEADCINPKICKDCGEKEGENLEHKWLDANYQKPQRCFECGETEGSSLTPSFAKHGLISNVSKDFTYSYVTVSSERHDIPIIGEAVFNSKIDPYDDLEGYECQITNIHLTFDDNNARRYGFAFSWGLADYYSYDPDADRTDDADSEESDIPGFRVGGKVSINGKDYETHYYFNFYTWWEGRIGKARIDIVTLVPTEYDGAIVWLGNYKHQGVAKTQSELTDEDTLWLRVKG